MSATQLPPGIELPPRVTFDGIHDVGLPWPLLQFTDEETLSSFCLTQLQATTALIAARAEAMRELFRRGELETLPPAFDRQPRTFSPGGEYLA